MASVYVFGCAGEIEMPEPAAFLNGRWIPASAATVSAGDAGFVLGITVAEQVRTFAGKLFRLGDHLTRLTRSMEIIGLDPGMSLEELGDVSHELVSRNYPLLPAGSDLGLSIFVTPGDYPTFAQGPTHPTVCLHTYPLPFHHWAAKYRTGQSLVTTNVEQVSERCWPRELKCRSRMHYYLADLQAAVIEPGSRALLLDGKGFVTEASTASLLIYRAGEGLLMPPSAKILHGISLATVVELAQEAGIVVGEREMTVGDVAEADEVFLTSTSMCLLPVTRLDGRPIGSGLPGDIFRRLLAAWSARVGVDIVAQAERFAGGD